MQSSENRNISNQISFHHEKQHDIIRFVENVVLTKIVHTADGTSVVQYVADGVHEDSMTDSKAM